MSLQHFDTDDFLANYWQRRPLLIRQGLPDFRCPVDGDDLAGLACEDGVESRLVIERSGRWSLEHGPFAEQRFARLPQTGWTLLVQAVDQWIEDVAVLTAHFRFIPRWRIDDIMISYAADGGGVGPHFDHYDVFLIQGSGCRRWRLGGFCDEHSALAANPELRLLERFQTEAEYLLEPGDILYLPPRIAHWGTAEGDDCITLSVGFRGPSSAELVSHWADDAITRLSESDRYRDPALRSTAHPGEIPAAAVAAARARVTSALESDQAFARWFGCLMTERKYAEAPCADGDGADFETAVKKLLLDGVQEGAAIEVALGARLAFMQRDERLLLFADGHALEPPACCRPLVLALCDLTPGETVPDTLYKGDASALCLLHKLCRLGTLKIYDEDR